MNHTGEQKTGYEWLESFHEDIRKKIDIYTKQNYGKGYETYMSQKRIFKDFCYSCFVFTNTKEGYDYWNNIFNLLISKHES